MNALAKLTTPSTSLGKCEGLINGSIPFKAGMVELLDATYPPPQNDAYVMRATQRAPGPDYSTKQLIISFAKGKPNNTYGLFPDAYTVRVLFVDHSATKRQVVYTQYMGQAIVAYDPASNNFSGQISVTLENLDEDTRRTLDLKIDFDAYQPAPARRIPRRPSALAVHC
ncbi:hypothetical protein PS718_03354 [Pseudomonas fluorescens]|mgnify:FL=1|uniref:Uncharacterized protein n=1 Tax=Pseudomonas fluorescens TaxID=294 RepID=A0A5E7CYA8_PSEFL|nr:hypothetical protein [Pseudomonas fluorescens]VVO10033.1 hypothetical protein PS718_03354 [Pseudomonas fluorescens]